MHMRVLVAGRNAKVLATAAGTFANDLTIETASTKAACFALLERTEFDLIVACETLGDGSGLEVLSHVAVNTPNTLRIFAARASTLNLLKGELGLFGLFRTLPYPINFRKLWAALNLARGCAVETGPPAQTPPAQTRTRAPNVRHVVLESGWQTGEPANAGSPAPQALTRRAARVNTTPPVQRPANTAVTTAARTGTAANTGKQQPRQAQPRQAVTARATPAPRQAAAASRRGAGIPESEAFKRALARRNAAKLDANSHISPVDVLGAAQQSHPGERRREPAMSNDSLAQLARLATTRRSTYDPRGLPGGKKRAALFVGSGVFAAVTAAVLTFFMLNANNSISRVALPLVASITRPVSQKVFPWQAAPQPQPTGTATAFIRSDATSPTAADLEVEAEAASEAPGIEPGHPGPPQPNPPPGPSEPPSEDSPGWVDE
jgi:hypothetical protein